MFLVGEYLAVAGGPAIVCAAGPRFVLREGSPGASPWHPESPAGRLWSGRPHDGIRYVDPYDGHGGLGASTAQFALAYALLSAKDRAAFPFDWRSAWSRYRELASGPGAPPSGADLVAQWEGGVRWVNPREGICEAIGGEFPWDSIRVFFTGQKVRTHEHLAALDARELGRSRWIPEARAIACQARAALEGRDPRALGGALSRYAEILAEAGIEAAESRKLREKLREIPGVLGAKGAGALLADLLVVVLESGGSPRLDAFARENGLRGIPGPLPDWQGIETSAD